MTYGSTVLATNFGRDSWQVRFWRAVLFFIPRANPDYEPLYQHVKKWYLELDDSRVPVREIGLDSAGRPLFAAPDERNFGFWTDSTEAFEPDHLSALSAEEFERLRLDSPISAEGITGDILLMELRYAGASWDAGPAGSQTVGLDLCSQMPSVGQRSCVALETHAIFEVLHDA